jgi:hypothetical protein
MGVYINVPCRFTLAPLDGLQEVAEAAGIWMLHLMEDAHARIEPVHATYCRHIHGRNRDNSAPHRSPQYLEYLRTMA